ncbi:MAG: hypothetical protein Q9182_004271 [Xanthomendoza sp. 2 TL-2023]
MTLYRASITTAKIAILLLYLRVFTTELKKFTIAVILIGSLILATGIATIVGSVLQCTPIAYSWDKTTPGRCINEVDFARYMAIPNVITGFAMLILPLPMVWRLKINVPQKIALTVTFLHGIIGFVASVVRLAILCEPTETTDKNLMALSRTIWTLIEPANYIIVASLPTLRPILIRILPAKFFLLTHASQRSRPYSILNISWPKGRSQSPPRARWPWSISTVHPGMLRKPGLVNLEASSLRKHRGRMMTAGDIKAPGDLADDEYPPLPACGGLLRHPQIPSRAARVPEIRVDSGIWF